MHLQYLKTAIGPHRWRDIVWAKGSRALPGTCVCSISVRLSPTWDNHVDIALIVKWRNHEYATYLPRWRYGWNKLYERAVK